MKKIIKIVPIASASVLAATFVLSSCGTSQKNVITYNGKNFDSKKSLIEYINKNVEKLEVKNGEKLYTVNIGSDTQEFSSYAKSIDFVSGKLKKQIAYLRPGFKVDQNDNTIKHSDFINASNAKEYIVFKKAAHSKDEEHTYTFAPSTRGVTNKEEIKTIKNKINAARIEAAKSYLQVHNAYKFDDKYFSSKNEIKAYILTRNATYFQTLKGKFDSKGSMTNMGLTTKLDTENNGLIEFDDLDKNSKSIPKEFIEKISRIAQPYYTTNKNKTYFKVDESNAANIAPFLDENKLNYIKVTPNNGKVTEIVDMDRATKNRDSNFYGNYFVKTAMGIDHINDLTNWNQLKGDEKPADAQTLVDVNVINSIMDYVLKIGGFKSPIDLFNQITLVKNGATFSEFLSQEGLKDDYWKALQELIIDLSHGVRYRNLNTIIASHSFIIDRMIQNHEDVANIKKAAKYFDSISILMDTLITKNLVPFFSKLNKNKIIPKDFKINYFRSSFSFYDENKIGAGINFQSNPYLYYRRLLGHHTNESNIKNNEAQNRKITFLLLKSWMASQSMMMKALTHNQIKFTEWAKNIETFAGMDYKNFINRKTSFVTNQNKEKFWSFKFNQKKNLSTSSEEYISLYSELSKIDFQYSWMKNDGTTSFYINKNEFMDGIEAYLVNLQNPIFEKYKKSIQNKQEDLYDGYLKNKNIEKKDFEINTLNYVTIDEEAFKVLEHNDFSRYSQVKHLSDMVSSAIEPLNERIKDFSIKVGTGIAKVAIAVASAGAGAAAEGSSMMMMEQETSTMLKFNSETNKISINVGKNGENLHFTRLEHKSHLEFKQKQTTTIIKKDVNKKSKKEEFKDKLVDELKDSGLSPEEAESGAANWVSSNLTEMFFGNSEGSAVIKDILDVGIGIMKNVIPGVSTLFNIIDSFSKTTKQIYKYNQNEDGTNFYWDGGKVHYSWWGLKADQEFSIDDLKLIKTHEILHGYESSNSGFYYEGKFHTDISELKEGAALELIKKVKSMDPDNPIKEDNIKWGIKLKNIDMEYFDTLGDLISSMWRYAFSVSKVIYKNNLGLLTSKGVASMANRQKFLKLLKPITIIAYPKDNGKSSVVPNEFKLPFPYWNGKKILTQDSKIDDSNEMLYYIYNPNLNLKKLASLGNKVPNAEQIKTFAKSDIFTNFDQIDKFSENFARKIFPKTKTVLFRDILTANSESGRKNDNNLYFENLNDEWRKNKKMVYSFIDSFGKEKYYIDPRKAMEKLSSKKELNLKSYYLSNAGFIYKFDNKYYKSVNEIYGNILKERGKNEK